MKKEMYLTLALATGLVMGLGTTAFSAPCPAEHCSKVSKKLYNACERDKNKGTAYFDNPSDPNGDMCSCPCSCYTESSAVLSEGKDVSVSSVDSGSSVVTVAGNTSVRRAMRSDVVNSPALQLELANGKSLTVSNNHALISADGVVTSAQDLVVGSKLSLEAGGATEVTAIKPTKYTGRFHNFITAGQSESGADRILIAGGVQNGDWTVQSFRDLLDENMGIRELILKGKAIHK